MKKHGWDKSVKVVGNDSPNQYVGPNEGAIQYLERLFGRSLIWDICLRHGNELGLRAVVFQLDGKSSGPTTLKGPVGRNLNQDFTTKQPVNFKKIPFEDFPLVPQEIVKEFSNDNHYLYRMTQAVICGECPLDLISR